MRKSLTKEERKRIRDKKSQGFRSPITGLQNQANIERLRQGQKSKSKYSLGKFTKREEGRYKNWIPKTDTSRSFWIWKGRFSNSPKEGEIANILKEMNLRFYRKVSFDMVKRFDFYIPLIDLVIEYDGGQHFKFLKEMANDIEKEKILNRNRIKYIRYNKTHNLKEQIAHDLVYHPILMK